MERMNCMKALSIAAVLLGPLVCHCSEKEPADPHMAVGPHLDTPNVPQSVDLRVRVVSGGVALFWTNGQPPEHVQYQIYRRQPGCTEFTLLNVHPVCRNKYRDLNVEPGSTYSYVVEQLSEDGDPLAVSPVVSVTVNHPEILLRKLEEAYNQKDLDKLRQCLADDFVCYRAVDRSNFEPWDRNEEIRILTNLFLGQGDEPSPDVSLRLNLIDKRLVEQEDQLPRWKLTCDVDFFLRFPVPKDGMRWLRWQGPTELTVVATLNDSGNWVLEECRDVGFTRPTCALADR